MNESLCSTESTVILVS